MFQKFVVCGGCQYFGYDGNGNVTTLVNAATGAIAWSLATTYYFASDAYANGVEKAIDNEVRDTGNTADYLVQKAVRIWEGGTVQK